MKNLFTILFSFLISIYSIGCNSSNSPTNSSGDSNGDGPEECWDGSTAYDLSDCPDQPGGSVEVYYNSDTPIAGFQFNVDGASVLSASGGEAQAAGFTISSSATTVIGFSLSGSVIPLGTGTLISLEIEGDSNLFCIKDLVLSNTDGEPIPAIIENCSTINSSE